ncbi:MAG: ribosome biogenesis GTP-binding protein YihA/YsxC [Bacilli bacterium]
MNIISVEEPVIAVRVSQYPESNKNEFLLVGRSNVGKSSFINTLIERKNFAHTSSKPGKTQTLNFYLVNKDFYLVDVPGYGYASVSKDKQKKFGLMIEDYIKNRENLKRVFLLIDYRHKPTEDDVLMYNYLKYYNLNITIVATKYDKVTKNNRAKQDKLIKDTLKLSSDDVFVPFSTITKKGREDILKIIESY